MAVATKRDPKKWAAAKSRAKRKMGGKHSARAMQLAVKYYKDAGGTSQVRRKPVTNYLSGQNKNGQRNQANQAARQASGIFPRKQSKHCHQRNMQRPPRQRETGLLPGNSS